MNENTFINNFNQVLKMNYVDKSLQQIHDQFINLISSFVNFKALTENEIKANQKVLAKISNQAEFIDFCENTSIGIYYKCCFWAKNNLKPETLTNVDSFVFEQHHIECRYMKKEYYNIKQNHYNLIDQKYNLVVLSYHMHIVMHVIRFIEYKYIDDLVFLTFIKPDLKEQQQNLPKTTIADFLLEQLKDNPDYFYVDQTIKELKVLAGQQGGIQNALKIMNPMINSYLQNEMNWKNSETNICLKFKANRFKILRELVIELNQNIPQNELPEDWNTNNKYLAICCTSMKDYLLATPIVDKRQSNDNPENIKYYYSPAYKKQWYLAEAETNFYRLKSIKQIREKPKQPYASKQPQPVKDLLQNTTIWHNQRYKIDSLIVSAGEFVNLVDLACKLLVLLPIEKRPKNFDKFSTDSKTRSIIVYELSSLICKKKKNIKTYYGWVYQYPH